MRRFKLVRKEDVSGVSGTGIVAEGCVFTGSGQVCLTWKGDHSSINIYKSVEDVIFVHGHHGASSLIFVDECDEKPEEVSILIQRCNTK